MILIEKEEKGGGEERRGGGRDAFKTRTHTSERVVGKNLKSIEKKTQKKSLEIGAGSLVKCIFKKKTFERKTLRS